MNCSEILDTFLIFFMRDKDMDNMDILIEYPNKKQDLPLRRPTLAIGLEEYKIVGTKTTEYCQAIARGASYCTVKVKMTLCVPKYGTGTACHTALDIVLKALGRMSNEELLTHIEVGETKYSKSLSCLAVPISVTVCNGNAYN